MATTVEGLFNLPTQQQAAQQYYEGLLTSPGQMNNLSLMQQISALGANAGAGIGYGAGRLLGGKAPDEVRIQGVNEAMAEATRMGGTDAEMYAALAKGLAARGLTQDAMAATERARTAKRDEQAITLAESQEARAVLGAQRDVLAEERSVEEAKRRVLADERDKELFEAKMKGLPNELRLTELNLLEVEKKLNGFKGEEALYGEALKNDIDPRTGKTFANDNERMRAKARFDEAKNQLKKEEDAVAREREKHEFTIKKLQADINQSKAAEAASNATRGMSAFKQKATIQIPDFMGKPTTYEVGTQNGLGQVRGKDGNLYNTVNEAARAQGIGAPADGAPADGAPATTAAPAAEKKAEPEASLLTNFLTNQPQANTPAQSPAFILQLQQETDELMLGKRKAYSPAVQAYLDKTQGTKAQNKAKQDEYKRQEQERMLRGNR
jgi:hypothetical protein